MGLEAGIAVAVAAAIALILGVIIGIAAKVFAVDTDPRIEEVGDLLPGANCGGCGYAGCGDFAKAVVAGDASPDACPVCSADTVNKICESLGMTAGNKEKMVALVRCGGNNSVALQSARYNGITDCVSASLVAGGPKACSAGCLGLASCSRGCPFDAIEIRDGLAIVHPEICVGCGKCVETCPRNLIIMVPASAETHIFCNSTEKGAGKKRNCSAACIGCRKCTKVVEEGQIEMDGFLARVNYENPPAANVVADAGCPTGCLRNDMTSVEDEAKNGEAA